MREVLRLARKGLGKVSPNPLVGAVVVHNGEVIGRGYHRAFGDAHAEVVALTQASRDVHGGTLYVNLEPCCHWGKTPPCVDAVLGAGIKRVVVATVDPNPIVREKGIQRLRDAGLCVDVGILEEEARRLNETYCTFMTLHRPFVTLKYAQSLDGRIATAQKDSRWISSEAARRFAHRLRAHHDAVMVGIGTVLADDPQLTVRMVRGKNPVRVVLDTGLRMPLDAKVLQGRAHTIVATAVPQDHVKHRNLKERRVETVVAAQGPDARVDLPHLLTMLADRGIASVLVEGGQQVATALMKHRLVDRMVVITAPLILGRGVEAIGDLGISSVDGALRPVSASIRRLSSDVVFDLRLRPPPFPGNAATAKKVACPF